MAAFNPQVEDVGTQRYIGYSEKSHPQNAWGTLFEGLVGAADTQIKTNLQQEASNMVKQADQDFFGLDTVTQQQKQNEEAGKASEPLPGPVQEGGDRIASLARARENGSLSQTNYWAHLNATVSELKAKWPGYSHEIDTYVSNAINSPTADQLRKSIIADYDAKTTSAAAKAKADDTFVKENLQYLNADQQKAWADGNLSSQDLSEIKITVGRARAQNQEIDHQKKELELIAATRTESDANLKNTQDKAFEYGNSAIRGIFADTYYSTMGSTGKSFQQFQSMISDFAKDGKIDDNELKQIAPVAQNLRTMLQQKKSDLYNKPDANGTRLTDVMRPDDMKKLDDVFDSQMKIIDDAMGGKADSLGLLNMNAALIKAGSESKTISVLGTSEGKIASDLKALNDSSGGLLGPVIQDHLMRDFANGTSPATQAIAGYLIGGGLTEGKSLYDMNAKTDGAASPRDRAKATANTIGVMIDAITTEGFTKEQKANAVSTLFGQKNVDFLRTIDDTVGKDGYSSRQRTFIRMTTPEVAKAIAAQGDQVASNYRNWILSSGPALFKSAGDTIQDTQTFAKYAKLGFDGKQFTIDVDESKFKDPQAAKDFLLGGPQKMGPHGPFRDQGFGDMLELNKFKNGVEAVKQANVFLRGYIPALEAAGVTDKQEQAKALTMALGGINLQAEKQSPFLDKLSSTITSMFSREDKAPRETQNDLKTSEPKGSIASSSPARDFEMGMAVEDKASTLMSRLVEDEGLTPQAAAGIVGNLRHESGLNPAIPGDSGTSIGWAQWHKERADDFREWTAKNGYDSTTDEGNYAYLIHDLKTNYPKVWDRIQGAKTVDQATDIFMNDYESPSVPVRSARLGHARDALARYTNNPSARAE